MSKNDEVNNLIMKQNIDILCIGETWLDDTITNGDVKVEGFFFL